MSSDCEHIQWTISRQVCTVHQKERCVKPQLVPMTMSTLPYAGPYAVPTPPVQLPAVEPSIPIDPLPDTVTT